MSSADSISLAPIVTEDNEHVTSKQYTEIAEIRQKIGSVKNVKQRNLPTRIFFCITSLITTLLVLVFGILGNIFQILTAPLMLVNKPMVVRWHSYLAGFIWSLLQHMVERQSGATFTLSGIDDLPVGENAFIISNHVCFADFVTIHAIAIRKKMLSFCKYFVKDSVKYIPIFGWGMKIMGMVMLQRNWAKDRAKFSSFFSLFTSGQLPVYLISYPEGSRITPAKLAKSQAYAEEMKLPPLNNLLLPRSKGFIATMMGLQDGDLKMVYDVTVVYYHTRKGLGATWSLLEMLTGQLDGYRVHIHVERIPFSRMPVAEDELKTWIFTRFQVKDGLVSSIGQVFKDVSEIKQA